MDLCQSLAASGEFGDDGIPRCGPDEGLGILVPGGEKIFNRGDKIVEAEKRIAPDALVGQFGNQRSIKFSQLQLVIMV